MTPTREQDIAALVGRLEELDNQATQGDFTVKNLRAAGMFPEYAKFIAALVNWWRGGGREALRELEAELAKVRKDAERYKERLRALLKGLEAKEIDGALELDPLALTILGMKIADAAKLGAHLLPRDSAIESAEKGLSTPDSDSR